MDGSSPVAMAGLISLKDRFDADLANESDVDRHGIVTKDGGRRNPNHHLAACIGYLRRSRRNDEPTNAAGHFATGALQSA